MELAGEDDWNFSAEELDSLERHALQQISELKSSSTAASSSSSSSTVHHRQNLQQANQIDASTLGANKLPPTASNSTADESKQQLPKVSAKFFLHSSGQIAAKFPYDPLLVKAFHNIPKASWNGKERLWMFPMSSLPLAEQVLSEVSGSNVVVENLDPLVHRAIAAAFAVPDLRGRYDLIPSNIESKLLPFQRDGVRFMLQHGGRALLADEMGLGKTLQAIAVASCIRDEWPVLVLTPSSLRLHWAAMIQEWLNIPPSDICNSKFQMHNEGAACKSQDRFAYAFGREVELFNSSNLQCHCVVLSQCGGSNKGGFNVLASNTKRSIQLDGLFNIISYDVVPKFQGVLMSSEFKVVVADESHFLKNAQAKRTNATIPILQKAHYVILLSGTPALSRPIELFKQLEALYPGVYKSVHEYGNRYCKGGFFGVYQGASNHEELHNLMKSTVMIRRLKKDVLSELPVKRRQQVFLELGEKEMRQVNALFRELEVIKSKIKACESKEEAESLKFSEKNLINKIYTESAEAKIPAVLEYLGTVIEAGCKFLIFAHHQPVIAAIHEYLLKKKVGCIRIDGGTPAASRQALVTDFQEKSSIRAAVLSIKAGGVGLTLTAASTVIFAELAWTPGDLIQAEDRAHRIGQVSSVNIYYLLASDTVDDIIWDVVQSKLENLGQMLDGHENTMEVSGDQKYQSPTKQRMRVSGDKKYSSPTKQRTLDCFMKRCSNNSSSGDEGPVLKQTKYY